MIRKFSILVLIIVLAAFWVPAATAQTPCNGVSYTVRTGDTLAAISAQFGVTINQIAATNGIANPNLIRIAQVLCIPAAGQGGAVAPAGNAAAPAVTTGAGGGTAATFAGNVVPVGTVDAQTGFTTTASVTLNDADNSLAISAAGMIPNAQTRVFISAAFGDLSGGIIAILTADANGNVNGTVTIPFLHGSTRHYVMVRAYDGRTRFGYFDLNPLTRFPG